MFEQIAREVPSARLCEVHRAREPWERRAWTQVREGHAQHALGEYQSRGRLHISDTREHAAQEMVYQARREHPQGRVLMLTDASNTELDRINTLAQEHRAQAGELGHHQAPVPGRPYSLRTGDRVILTGQLRPAGQERVENGSTGEVLAVAPRGGAVTMRTAEPQPREVSFDTREFSDARLGYAQHVYKAQGATVDRALVLTGGWQPTATAPTSPCRARGNPPTSTSPASTSASRALIQVPSPGSGSAWPKATPSSRASRATKFRRHRRRALTADRTQPPELEQERFGLAPSTSPAGRGDDARESEVGPILREQQEREQQEREQDRSNWHGLGLE